MFDKKFNLVIGLFLILFISVTFLSLTSTRLPFLTQASNKELDITKTVVIISKLETKADGKDFSLITVFTRNKNAAAIAGKRVDISTNLGTLDNPSMISDDYGKTEFKLSSILSGRADLTIRIDDQTLTTPYWVNFVNN